MLRKKDKYTTDQSSAETADTGDSGNEDTETGEITTEVLKQKLSINGDIIFDDVQLDEY